MSDNITILKEWHKLYDQGIITEEEFNDKKKELLGLESGSSPLNNLTQNETSSEKKQLESLENLDVNKNNSITNGNCNARNIKRPSSMSANSIFFISLAIIGAVIFIFWLLNRSKSDNADISNSYRNAFEMKDSTEIVYDEENLSRVADSAALAHMEDRTQDQKKTEEKPNKNEDIEFDSFFVQFKQAVATKNKKRALELTNVNEFSAGGGLETASEWFDNVFENPNYYSDFLDTLKKGAEKETHRFPSGEKYKLIINEDEVAEGGGGHFFTIENGKWKFGGYMH